MAYTQKLFPNILMSNVEHWVLLLMILIGKCKWIWKFWPLADAEENVLDNKNLEEIAIALCDKTGGIINGLVGELPQ